MDNTIRLNQVRNELNEKSPSLCLAKWLQVTINLQNGTGHSCHHPIVHKIPLSEIEANPSALHNTQYKKDQREKMKKGERPKECDYCWKIEDSSAENFSDRTLKSAESWAYDSLPEVWNKPSSWDVGPTYVEISFGSECNFKCAYCSPLVSSAIQAEFQKHGAYTSQPYFQLEHLKTKGLLPYAKDAPNPYVDAFWQWWPELMKTLKVFRITGGEPLLNPNTFRFLNALVTTPMPQLDLAINTNLGVPPVTLEKFLALSSDVIKKKAIKKFEVYTSIDTYGLQAEYIRHGLSNHTFWQNIDKTLMTLPQVNVVIMCTFNALSFYSFQNLLEEIKSLKLKYRTVDDQSPRLELSTSFLRFPLFMAPDLVPKEHLQYLEKALDFMLRNSRLQEKIIFSDHEILQVRRLLDMLRIQEIPASVKEQRQLAFYQFFKEYDARKSTEFVTTFPELKGFYEQGKSFLMNKILAEK